MFELVKKTQVNEAVVEYVFYAPLIAAKGKPGQFVLFRIDNLGERVPITLCGINAKEGTITLLIQAAGASTMQLSALQVGDRLKDIVGPLGNATDLEGCERVLLVAGGIGVAVLYPQAEALRAAGKKVTCIYGARNKGQFVYLDKLERVCDELILATDDGSLGITGNAVAAMEQLLEKDAKAFDLAFAVGPLPMMRATCAMTKRYGLKTIVSMNPIMIDGTGMCGGCRLTVGGEVKYACVDGPEFDGHKVDFDEVMSRNRFYADIEKEHICRLTGGRVNG